MIKNININNFFPVTLSGISFNPVGENSNQTVYICNNTGVTFPDGRWFVQVTSALDWLSFSGTTPQDSEYQLLKNYFDGISYETGGNTPQGAAPRSCILLKFVPTGVIGKIQGNNVAADIMTTIGAWSDKANVNLTLKINAVSVPLTIDCTSITTQVQLAAAIETALKAYVVSSERKIKANAIYPNATCVWDNTTSKFTISPLNAVGGIHIGYCSSTGENDLAALMKLTELSLPTITQGVNEMYLGGAMQRLVNAGVMNFSQFQTMYYDCDITQESVKQNILTAIEWTESQKIHFCYLLTCKMSQYQGILDFLVTNKMFEAIKDESQTIIEYRPLVGGIQISVLLDGMGADFVPRTQADYYSNSVISGAVVGASGNRYATNNANCRNIAGTQYDNVTVDYATEAELELIQKGGAILYCSLPANAIAFSQAATSGRNTKNLVWFDLWQNALFAGFRIQLKMVELERQGILSRPTAFSAMTEAVTELNVAGFITPPAIPFDYKSNKIDNDYITYATTREYGLATESLKTSVQNSLNSNAMSFNIVTYQQALNQGFNLKDFIEFIYDMGSESLTNKLVKKLQDKGKIVVLLKQLPVEVEKKLSSVNNKFVLLEGKKHHKPLIIKQHSSESQTVGDDEIIMYTPTTIRELGLINIVDFTPDQWFNGVSTFLNQLNIG